MRAPLYIVAILVTLGLTYFYQQQQYIKNSVVFQHYPWSLRIFFVPIYEEIIFRGLILYFITHYSTAHFAVIISSLLFGLWHLKNYRLQPKWASAYQIFYAGFIIGPILAMITIITGTLYMAILIHSLNNLLSPVFTSILNREYGKRKTE